MDALMAKEDIPEHLKIGKTKESLGWIYQEIKIEDAPKFTYEIRIMSKDASKLLYRNITKEQMKEIEKILNIKAEDWNK